MSELGKMVRRIRSLLLLGAVLLPAVPRPAAACGGGGVTSVTSGVLASSQRIFLSVRAATTDIVVQIGVPATTADYGVLIPVPSMPTLDPQPVAESDLVALDQVTAPKIYVRTGGNDSDAGCGCASKAGGNAGGGLESDGGVSVSDPVNIGPVEAVVLSADTGDALAAWLASHGFALSVGGQAIVTAYSGPGTHFIAVRRSSTASSGGPTSIGLHYTLPGAHKKLSLGFARLGAAPTVSFTLFLAAPEANGPAAPFAALSLLDLDRGLLAAGNYAAAVAGAIAKKSSKAFVVEKAMPGAMVAAALGPGLAGLLDSGAVVTRMSTIIAAEALQDDATFTGPYTGDVSGQRYVTAARPDRTHFAGGWGGLFPGLALAAVGVFRRRRRP